MYHVDGKPEICWNISVINFHVLCNHHGKLTLPNNYSMRDGFEYEWMYSQLEHDCAFLTPGYSRYFIRHCQPLVFFDVVPAVKFIHLPPVSYLVSHVSRFGGSIQTNCAQTSVDCFDKHSMAL